jgi:hypothetical protein
MAVLVQEATTATVLLNMTLLDPCVLPNPVPVSAIVAPFAALAGTTFVTAGCVPPQPAINPATMTAMQTAADTANVLLVMPHLRLSAAQVVEYLWREPHPGPPRKPVSRLNARQSK